VQMANQMGMVFAKLNCKPRWRKRLLELSIPTLAVHGRRDPFFPVGNGEAPRARDSRCAAARARTSRDCDPRCGRR
jgi:pimeloyl-ACP methyl ester carboxylesterase